MRGRWWLVVIGVAAALPSQWVRWRAKGRVSSPHTVPPVGMALVLGAGVRRDGRPSRILHGRLRVAKELYVLGKVNRLLVSGSPESRGHSEPKVMRDYLITHGVPPADIVIDESGVNTWRSCYVAAHEFGQRRMTVVTTNFHLQRAIWLCRRAGVDVYGVGHDARADGLRRVAAKGAIREVLATSKAFWWPQRMK